MAATRRTTGPRRTLAWVFPIVFLSIGFTLPQAGGRPYDLVIAHGRIVDGTGAPSFRGDVAIRGDRIVALGDLGPYRTRRTLDAAGCVVCPGFIDMMGQSDTSVLADARAESKVRQGITTEVIGEGSSVAPLDGPLAAKMALELKPLGVNVDWLTLHDYFARLKRTPPAINVASFVGASLVRRLVLGEADRPPTGEELKRMRALVRQAMKDGAVGLSSALVYPPGTFAGTEELIALAREAARGGGLYATHLRSEGERIDAALAEAFRIGREAGLPVEIYHLKAAGPKQRGKMGNILEAIETARRDGLDVTADMYPYVAAATALSACIPPWALDSRDGGLPARLADPDTRERIKNEIRLPDSPFESFYRLAGGGEGILVASVGHRSLAAHEGKRLPEVARAMGRPDVLDALLDLVAEDDGATGAIYFIMDEPDVRLALRRPWVSFCTDHSAVSLSGPLAVGKPHPRAWGAYPRVLGQYVREEGLLPLEEAVRRMTSLPAARVRLKGRGELRPGFFADLTVFDPAAIRDETTWEKPDVPPRGVRHVVVNGVPVLADGVQSTERPGRPLRPEGPRRPLGAAREK